MAIAELTPRGLGRFFGRASQIEAPTFVAGAELPVCPVSEGDDQTGGSDLSQSAEPQHLRVRIVGSRDPLTGEIASYHQEVHGTFMLYPLTEGTPISVT